MGNWKPDQSKKPRRKIWGETRGQSDETWQEFAKRFKEAPPLDKLRLEKVGTEIHAWRQILDEKKGEPYWMSCLRFVDDGWSYWTVLYRTDERRWRTTDIRGLPMSRAITAAAQWYKKKLVDA
jgi:hypothetical protein